MYMWLMVIRLDTDRTHARLWSEKNITPHKEPKVPNHEILVAQFFHMLKAKFHPLLHLGASTTQPG